MAFENPREYSRKLNPVTTQLMVKSINEIAEGNVN